MTEEATTPARPETRPPDSERPPTGMETALRGLRTIGPDLLFRIVLVTLLGVLVWPMAMPILLGGITAIVLRPLDDRLAARLGRLRRASPGIITSAAIVCVLVPLSFVAYRIVIALNTFVASLLGGEAGAPRDRLVDFLVDVFGSAVDRAAIARTFDDVVRQLGTALASALANYAKGLPETITDLFLFLLALYFGLRDGPKLVAWARRVSPVSRTRTSELFEAIRRSVNGTIVGTVVVAVVQGGLAMIAMAACRVTDAVLWGFIAAICSVLPILGTTPVTIGAAVWLYAQHRPIAAIVMVGCALVIGVSDNVVRPWVQSQHDDVHPLLALLSIFGGLAIFGPAGLFLGPVIASMAVWAVETYRDERRAR